MDLATLQRMHPSWSLVDFLPAPNGGLWALGSDGGVFSLDSTGGTAGTVAPFFGSYTSLANQDPNRKFQRIEVNGGGYQLVDVNQNVYGKAGEFAPPPAAKPDTTTTAAPVTDQQSASTGQNVSGLAAIHAVFDPIGLGGLAEQAFNFMNQTPGADANYINQVWLPQQDAYKQMFPEIAQTQAQVAAGKNVAIPTPAAIVSYRQQAQQMVAQGLLPPELATNDQIGKLIVGGTSIGEFETRVNQGWAQIQSAPDDLAAFLAYHPSLDASHAVGALLDPTLGDQAARNAITQAQIGGGATRSGFGSISAAQATALQQAGLSGASAQSALSREAMLNPLTQANIGEDNNLTRDTLVSDVAGNAGASQAVQNRLRSRQAAFQGGGGAASGNGKTGLG